jgi:hypothetical protein
MAPGGMASVKRTPKVSRISRDRTVAYVRKQKSTPGGGDGGEAGGLNADAPDPPDPTAEKPAEAAGPGEALTVPMTDAPVPEASAPGASAPDAAALSEPQGKPPAAATAPIEPPNPSVEPWPDATPLPMKPVDPARARVSTVTMPAQTSLGGPPAMPEGAAVANAVMEVGAAEEPTRMPGPREIPEGDPDDPAPPPGYVPAGDSRSMRRRTDQNEFALIYRIQTYVISRFGMVGKRGQWRVVEYPTLASAGHAYAKECSRFVSEGFSDYRA